MREFFQYFSHFHFTGVLRSNDARCARQLLQGMGAWIDTSEARVL